MILPPGEEGVDAAVRALSAGLVVGVPTDTVYGIAVDPKMPGATSRLFALKERPPEVNLAVLIAEPEEASQLADVTLPLAAELIERFWPGPLTLVLPRRPEVVLDLGGDVSTIGIRCPDFAIVRELASRVGPLATTSANRHREPTPDTAEGVDEVFGDGIEVVIDGGRLVGAASTVVDLAGGEPRVLREGPISAAQLFGA